MSGLSFAGIQAIADKLRENNIAPCQDGHYRIHVHPTNFQGILLYELLVSTRASYRVGLHAWAYFARDERAGHIPSAGDCLARALLLEP